MKALAKVQACLFVAGVLTLGGSVATFSGWLRGSGMLLTTAWVVLAWAFVFGFRSWRAGDL